MKITLENKKKKNENIQKAYPEAQIIDVTLKGTSPFVKFSPFFPIGTLSHFQKESSLCQLRAFGKV
jgi:hypothetical protein